MSGAGSLVDLKKKNSDAKKKLNAKYRREANPYGGGGQAASLNDFKTKLSHHSLNTAFRKRSIYCFNFFLTFIIAFR